MASLELSVGGHWKENVRYLSEYPFRPADAAINFMEIRDVIDVVVDGNNITATLDQESIFGVVGQLLEALLSLNDGATKYLLEFPVEPFELVLVPDQQRLLLSLYSIDRSRLVLAHDVPVDAGLFATAVADLAEELLTEVLKIDERFSTDPFLRSFGADLSRVRRLGDLSFRAQPQEESGGAYGSTSSADGLSLSFEFTNTTNLVGYDGTLAFDQHALLTRGSMNAEWCGRKVTLNARYPILAVHSVLRRCRELLNLIQAPQTEFRCDSELGHIAIGVASKGARWEVNLGTGDESLRFETSATAFLDGFLSFAELALREVRRLAPSIEVNQRFSDLQQEARALRAWYEDLSQTNVYLEQPEEFLKAHAGVEPLADSHAQATFSWPFESVRALYPERRWTYESARIHFAAVTQTDDRILIPTSEALIAIDAGSGEELWSAKERGGIPLSSYAMVGDLVLLANEGGDVWLANATTGEDVGTIDRCGSSLLLDAAVYESSKVGVLADFHGQLRAFDTETTETLWEHAMGHGYLTGVVFDGPLICLLSTPGYIQAIAPLTGKVLWNVKLGGVADAGPFAHQGRLFAITHDHVGPSLAVHAVQPFTGRAAWHLRLHGTLAGAPNFAHGWMVVPVERHGRIQLLGIEVESPEPAVAWSIELMSAGLDRPTAVASFDLDGELHGAIRTDRGELTCFRFSDGAIRWRIKPDPPGSLLFRNLNMLVVRDSLLIVGETIELRSLEDGHLLHKFGDVLEAPEYLGAAGSLALIVGEPGRGEVEDQMICLTLGHFLAVV